MSFMRNLAYTGLSAVVLAGSSLAGCSSEKLKEPPSVSVYEEPEPVFYRDDLIPEKGEFFAAKGLDEEDLDVLFSDSKFERRKNYFSKIELIRENPSEVFKFLTNEEKERYNDFLKKTINSANNLDRLDSDFDWRDNIRQDYDIYDPEIDFDNPSDSDLLIILFHESFYKGNNKGLVSKIEESGDFEIWKPLYTVMDTGSFRVPFKVADVRYYLDPSSIENFARNLPGTMDEEEAWNKICEYARNPKNTIKFEVELYRKVDNYFDCKKRIQEIFPIDLESVGSISRKYVASSEFQDKEFELVELRKEITNGESASAALRGIFGVWDTFNGFCEAVKVGAEVQHGVGEALEEGFNSIGVGGFNSNEVKPCPKCGEYHQKPKPKPCPDCGKYH